MTEGKSMQELLAKLLRLTLGVSELKGNESFAFYYPSEVFKPMDKEARDGKMVVSHTHEMADNEVEVGFEILLDAKATLDIETLKPTAKKTNATYEFKAMAKNLQSNYWGKDSYLLVMLDFVESARECHNMLKLIKARGIKTLSERRVFFIDGDFYVSANLYNIGLKELGSEYSITDREPVVLSSRDDMNDVFGANYTIQYILRGQYGEHCYMDRFTMNLRSLAHTFKDISDECFKILEAPIGDEKIVELFSERMTFSDEWDSSYFYNLVRVDGGFEADLKSNNTWYNNRKEGDVTRFKLVVRQAELVDLVLYEKTRFSTETPIIAKTIPNITPWKAKNEVVKIERAYKRLDQAKEKLEQLLK